jgi:UDP-glucose 4-epimerase
MRLLVTGGAAFIGSHIAEAALSEGYEVAVLDDLSRGRREYVPQGSAFFLCDLRDRASVLRCFDEFRPELVSHHAAQSNVTFSLENPFEDANINLIGGINLLDACTAPGARVKRLVFASSGGAIYGEVPEGQRAAEDSVPAPLTPYGIHKLAFEQLLSVYARHRKLPSQSLRYANIYGPRQDPRGEAGVVASFMTRALRGDPLAISGRERRHDLGCVRDYVYVADAVRANLLALAGKLGPATLNVATGRETTTLALAEKIRTLVGNTPPFEFREPRPGDVQRSVLDSRHCERELGPMTPLEIGLLPTAAWFRSQM